MFKIATSRKIRPTAWARQAFESGSAKWWPGLALIVVSFIAFVVMFGLAEIVFVRQLSASGWDDAISRIATAIACPPIAAGVLMLIKRLRVNLQADPFYIVVITAQLGHALWLLLTTFVGMLGLALLLSGISPLSGAVAVFSLAFIVIGSGLAERPGPKMELNSLFLLKRIANWQLVAGSAVIALLYEVPTPGTPLLIQLGDNRGLMFVLMILWVVGAGASTVFLEPLKYKLEENPPRPKPTASINSNSQEHN